MKREQDLRRRLHTLSTLHEVVSAMKSLSAHHFRLCRKSLPAARAYRAEIEKAIADIGITQTIEFRAPPGLLLITSDLGLCGDYNTRLLQVAIDEQRQESKGFLYCVGRRSHTMLTRLNIFPQRVYPAPASVQGLPGLLLQLAQDLLDDYTQQKIGYLDVVSGRFEGVGHFSPVLTRVLPIELARAGPPLRPTSYESAGHLIAVAVREFLYITLYEFLLDALASEHGMRLVSAESARQWLDSTTESVRRQLATCRREATTQEVLDIVAGTKPRLRHD